MDRLRVGIVGATGMVGQRFIRLLAGHPWFKIECLAASKNSAGRTYGEIMRDRWAADEPVPAAVRQMVVKDATDMDAIVDECDFIFSAVSMDKEAVKVFEEDFARRETPVVSANSAHRFTPDVPMMIPEINPHHADIIPAQRKRLGCSRGFIAVKPNCSIQPYVPALTALADFVPTQAFVCTYQAISGAGKTFDTWPEMADNVIPFIGGEEEKSIKEPLKVWGTIEDGAIKHATSPVISAQCIRVPVSDGHMAAVSVKFEKKPPRDEIIARWRAFSGKPQEMKLPLAPDPFMVYFEEDNRPQTRLDRDTGRGMAVTLGRLRDDEIFDYKFIALSHNTLRGAAGGAVLTAEYLKASGYLGAK